MVSEKRAHSRVRAALVLGPAVVIAFLGLIGFAQLPQDPVYHQFADRRVIYGVPHFWNVVSNVPFAVVGLLGCWWIVRHGRTSPAFDESYERVAYLVFFAGEFLICFGSGYYHSGPWAWTAGLIIGHALLFVRVTMTPAAVHPHESPLYRGLSRVYDHSFGRVFQPRITRVVRSLGIPPGARVLEIGCGTGISFEAYPPYCQVVGIDLAEDMLERARRRITANRWSHIRVERGDALNLSFPDASFDFVMAFHVISVVRDPRRMMAEAQRVCRDGGTIVVINHFRSDNTVIAGLQRSMDPVTGRLGWTTLRLGELLRIRSLDITRVWKTSARSLFTIVEARNRTAPVRAAMDRSRDADGRSALRAPVAGGWRT